MSVLSALFRKAPHHQTVENVRAQAYFQSLRCDPTTAGICKTFGMPNCICHDSLRVRLSLARSISYRSFGHFLRLPANRKKQIRTSEHLRGSKETLQLRNKLLAPAQEALDKQFEETFHLTRDHALPSNSPGETHATTGTCRMDVDGPRRSNH